MLVMLEQKEKALSPISFTDFGIQMSVSFSQQKKARSSISSSPSKITKDVNCFFGSFCAINEGPSALVRFVQLSKVASPISVTDEGMVILVRLEQPEKALLPISITDGGMEMPVRLVQPEKAHSPIFVTDVGMMVFLHPLIRVLLSV